MSDELICWKCELGATEYYPLHELYGRYQHPAEINCIRVLQDELDAAIARAETAEAGLDAADKRYRELVNRQIEDAFSAGWWKVGAEQPDEGGLYIATVITEFYDGCWRSEDHEVDLSRYVRMYRDAPYAPEDSDE